MKKFLPLLSALVLLFAFTSFSQFSAGYTNAGNVITFKIRPSATVTTGFSVFEFFVRYPETSPTFVYGTPVANNVDFPGMTVNQTPGQGAWEIERNNPAYQIAGSGYTVDHILYTAPAPNTASNTYNNGQVYDVVSIPVIGVNDQIVNFELVHQNSEEAFYLAITDQLGGDIRPAAVADYFFPTTSEVAGPNASTIYFSALAVPLPVKFTGFNVIKKNKADAVITWQVENENALTDRYEIERSLNGIDFKKINAIAPKNNGKSSNSYILTDLNLSSIRTSGIFYYRVRQVDKDARFITTTMKSLRLNSNGLVLGVYPNPVSNFATVSIDLEQTEDAIFTLHDASGTQVQTIPMQLFKGPNIKKVNMETLPAGSYTLKVQTATEIKMMPIVKSKN